MGSPPKQKRKKRIKDGNKTASPEELRLTAIGILWEVVTKRTIDSEEYIVEIEKYKTKWEQKNPGKKWDGRVPRRYCVTLKDGTTANVDTWVNYQKRKRKKRIKAGNKKASPEEIPTDIGILWEVVTKRTIDLKSTLLKLKNKN